MFSQRPPVRVLLQEWDLPLVLQDLASEEFQPLSRLSMLDLARKKAFLVAVACGRRCLEVQAISIEEAHLCITQGGV